MPCVAAPENACWVSWQATLSAVWWSSKPGWAVRRIIDTVMQGGDTDTNAAIAGALLGALHGEDSLPGHWREAILNCRPSTENPDAVRVRPDIYWPVDALELADALLIAGRTPRNA